MITTEQMLDLLTSLVMFGIRPPETATGPKGMLLAAKSYAMALNHAGMTLEDVTSAVLTYVNEPHRSGYPKPWPDPGALIARTPENLRRAALPDDAAVQWQRVLVFARNSGNPPADYADNEATRIAIRYGLRAIGGLKAMGYADARERESMERTFRAEYTRVRETQRAPAMNRHPQIETDA